MDNDISDANKTLMDRINEVECLLVSYNDKIVKLRCSLDAISAEPNLSEQAYAMCRQVLFDTKP